MTDKHFRIYEPEDVNPLYRGGANLILAGSFKGRAPSDLPLIVRGVNPSRTNLRKVINQGAVYVERNLVLPDESTFLNSHSEAELSVSPSISRGALNSLSGKNLSKLFSLAI